MSKRRHACLTNRWLFVSFHEPYYTSAGTFQMGTYFKVRFMEVSFYQPSRFCRVLEQTCFQVHSMQRLYASQLTTPPVIENASPRMHTRCNTAQQRRACRHRSNMVAHGADCSSSISMSHRAA